MRRLLLLALAAALVAPAALAKGVFPATIPLPDGFQPEGIAIGDGTTFYVGSIPTGAIYAATCAPAPGRCGSRAPPAAPPPASKYDRGRLWVSGASTGKAFVYDAKTGRLIREYQLATGGSRFVNDVVVTKGAAYFTDSARPVLYRIALSATGAPGAREDPQARRRLRARRRRLQPERHRREPDRQHAARGAEPDREAVRDRPGDGHGEDGRPGRPRARERRRPPPARQEPVRRAEPAEQDRRRPARGRPRERHARAHDHRLGLRRADDGRPRYGNWLYAVNARFGTATADDDSYAVVQTRR